MSKLNLKLEEIRKKQRMKRILEEDLVNKGATAQMAQSFVMNLDQQDLKRMHPQETEKRFTRNQNMAKTVEQQEPVNTVTFDKKALTVRGGKSRQKDRGVQKTHGEKIQEFHVQERKLLSRLEILMHKMDDFEMKGQAYKLSGLELTKKAITFQKEKNQRLRELSKAAVLPSD